MHFQFGVVDSKKDRRWGVAWRPLEGALDYHKYTTDAALRLHNYRNYREVHGTVLLKNVFRISAKAHFSLDIRRGGGQ